MKMTCREFTEKNPFLFVFFDDYGQKIGETCDVDKAHKVFAAIKDYKKFADMPQALKNALAMSIM